MKDTGRRTPSTRTAVGLAPRDGDVVVARDQRSAGRHTVAQVPGTSQTIVVAEQAAIRLALDIARARHVDVWYAEDGGHRLIEAFRPTGC